WQVVAIEVRLVDVAALYEPALIRDAHPLVTWFRLLQGGLRVGVQIVELDEADVVFVVADQSPGPVCEPAAADQAVVAGAFEGASPAEWVVHVSERGCNIAVSVRRTA